MAESRKPLALRHLQSRWPTCQHRSVNTSRCSAWAQPPGPHQAGPWLAGVASWCGGSSVPQLKGGPSHTHTHNPAEAQWVGVSCVCMHATSPTTKIHAPPHALFLPPAKTKIDPPSQERNSCSRIQSAISPLLSVWLLLKKLKPTES